jgi:hypothetical protein
VLYKGNSAILLDSQWSRLVKKSGFSVHIIRDVDQIDLEELQNFTGEKETGSAQVSKLLMPYWESLINLSD